MEITRSDLLTAAEAADRFGCTARAVRKWLAAGRLDGFRIAGSWVIPANEVERYARERAAATA